MPKISLKRHLVGLMTKIVSLNSASSGQADPVPTMTSSVLRRADPVSGADVLRGGLSFFFPESNRSELSFPVCHTSEHRAPPPEDFCP